MMNLIARSNERAPSALSSAASESPGKTRFESQSPLSSQAEKYDRTVRPVVCLHANHGRQHSRRVINDLDNVDFVPSNVLSKQ